jgi:VanZ family protein
MASPIWLDLQALRWWRLLGLCLICSIVFLSLQANPMELSRVEMGDKWAHLLAYGVLMAWFGLIVHRRWQWLPAVLFVLLGVGLEFIQGLTGYRYFDMADMLANALGVMLGYWLCATRFRYFLSHLESRFLPSS